MNLVLTFVFCSIAVGIVTLFLVRKGDPRVGFMTVVQVAMLLLAQDRFSFVPSSQGFDEILRQMVSWFYLAWAMLGLSVGRIIL
jgi:hypothetical protein